MSSRRSDVTWEQFGHEDPYFGVLSNDRFRLARTDGAIRDEFFGSGEAHVERVFAIIRADLEPAFSPARALDFGCGVGRLVLPLARRVWHVTGLDVSEGMLQEAQRNCSEAGLDNVTLVRSDDHLTHLRGTFDFIHSFIVFQHIPAKRGEAIVDRLLERLETGGVAALHFSYSDDRPLTRRLVNRVQASVPGVRQLVNVVKRRPVAYPHMEMHRYRIERLLDLLQARGCGQVSIRFSSHGGYRGVFLFARRSPQPDF